MFVEAGRLDNRPGQPLLDGLREIARAHPGGFRLTPNQNLIIANVAARDRQLIDFESVLELTAAILLTEPSFAREVHAAFRYFTVDEFQDVNPLQKLLLDAWLGGRSELCVVGDPQQTIYSFTGATSQYLRSFGADYPDASVIRLVRDYRSTPQVVAATSPKARSEIGRRFARRSRRPVKNAEE